MVDPKRILRKLEMTHVTDYNDIVGKPESKFIYPFHTVQYTDEDGQEISLDICFTLHQGYVARYRGVNTVAVMQSGATWTTFYDQVLDEQDRKALGDWTPLKVKYSLSPTFAALRNIEWKTEILEHEQRLSLVK